MTKMEGFEVRGTALANKLVTWHNMLNETGYNLKLSNYPYKYVKKRAERMQVGHSKSSSRKRKRYSRSSTPHHLWNFQHDGYFCDNPRSSYAKWIFEVDNTKISLWSVDGLLSACRSEKWLLNHSTYPNICIRQSLATCCPTMSLPNYVAYMAGLGTCENITYASLSKVERILRNCATYYCQGSLKSYCWISGKITSNCPDIPKICTDYNIAYSIFHFLLQQKFVCPFLLNSTLNRSMVFAPAFQHKNLLGLYYDNFDGNQVNDGIIHVSAIDFDLKDQVFVELLYSDAVYPLLAMCAVALIIYLYTNSVFVTVMNLVSTVSAMSLAYFFYTIVFDFTYFPFMNITALLVMMGMSADNVLVFYSAWRMYAEEDECHKNIPLNHKPIPSRICAVARVTINHVAWSLFVTGFTTAAAFFSNFSSQVTAIKCFGMYTGLTVLSNLLLSLTWLPATIIFHHKHLNFTCFKYVKFDVAVFLFFYKRWLKLSGWIFEIARIFFEKIQVLIIIRLRFIWTFIYLTLAIGGIYIVLVYPGFKLPTSSTYFQYFRTSHPFEVYSFQQNQEFAFQNQSMQYLPIRIIFGILPLDSGDDRNPYNTGHLQFQKNFNISDRRSQIWLLNFCKMIRNITYFKEAENTYTKEAYTMCFIETFKNWMASRKCTLATLDCCQKYYFPFPPVIFERCLKEAIFQINVTPRVRLLRSTPGPRYDKYDILRSVIIEFDSTQLASSSHEDVWKFYESMENLLTPQLETAPSGLAGGWFISDLEFFALQSELYSGTAASVGWSLLIALIMILITSRNLLVSIFASLTVAGIIFVTAASLILMKWELNILESVTISIAVGLSVDFTVHYAVAYLVAPCDKDRQQRVEFAAARMGPPLALAALTTFLAGIGMMPASVLAYMRFGIFLMLIMAISLLYSSYFFLGLLSILGPEGRNCELQCHGKHNLEKEGRVTTASVSCDNVFLEHDTVV